VTESALQQVPSFVFQPHGGGVDGMLHQPMHLALGPHAHRMEHEVGNVGLLSLVHHVVMLVNMENVRWRNLVCLPSLPPSRKRMIVTLHNHRHRTRCPVEQLLETVSGIGHLIEVIEVDIKDGVHCLLSSAEHETQRRGLRASAGVSCWPSTSCRLA